MKKFISLLAAALLALGCLAGCSDGGSGTKNTGATGTNTSAGSLNQELSRDYQNNGNPLQLTGASRTEYGSLNAAGSDYQNSGVTGAASPGSDVRITAEM